MGVERQSRDRADNPNRGRRYPKAKPNQSYTSRGPKREYGSEYDPYGMPEATIGECRNYGKSRNCKGLRTELADGLCMYCWDRWVSTASAGKRQDHAGVKNPKGRPSQKEYRGGSITKPTYGKQSNGNGRRAHPFDK